MSKLVELSLWLERTFDPPPSVRTVKKHLDQIEPPPVKVGATIYVAPDARFAQNDSPKSLLHHVRGTSKAA